MKNFYDAITIRDELYLALALTLNPVDCPICQVEINGKTVFNGPLEQAQTLTGHVKLNDPIAITIQLSDRQHPQAVEPVLYIDTKEVIPLYQHHADPAISYIDTNDVWQLEIPNFYQWYHTVSSQGDIY